jgi:uncharacterized protein (TIGR03032 family)
VLAATLFHHYRGIQCHEIAWGTTASGEPDLWIVNTLFSCLAGLDLRYSFVPRWRPPFISQLAPQDRCHLNGLAMRDGSPAFVTVMASHDEPRVAKRRNDSGRVLDVASGEAVTNGLANAHSRAGTTGTSSSSTPGSVGSSV